MQSIAAEHRCCEDTAVLALVPLRSDLVRGLCVAFSDGTREIWLTISATCVRVFSVASAKPAISVGHIRSW